MCDKRANRSECTSVDAARAGGFGQLGAEDGANV